MIDSKHPFAICNYTKELELNDEPSMTIPDLTLTIKDLYNRYRLGTLPAEFVRAVLYDESDDFDSIVSEQLENFDLVDADRELAKLRQKFDLMRGHIHSNTSDVQASTRAEVNDKQVDVGTLEV